MAPKVRPNAAATPTPAAGQAPEPPTVLTVWRKSLLSDYDGFAVYDARGDLAFHVESTAASRRRAEVVLMDAAGTPLLTVRRRRLSLPERWVIYEYDGGAEDDADGSAITSTSTRSPPVPLLSVRRNVVGGLLRGKTLAHVASSAQAAAELALVVEGSYGRRACAVRDARGDVVAEVRRKEAVGDDVFRLVVSPRLGAPLAMGIVIALDKMFGRSARPSLLRRACC